ncbi:MAG: hypothetical protein H6973_07000 [Gammaproteobacteria bacterium]|nr:hypothetical protein [Gammaproteobacteria bacterium]
MSFSDYKTLAQVQREYQIKYAEGVFIEKNLLPPADTFLVEFDFNINTMDAFSSEAARCELLIFPVLREAYKKLSTEMELWIQKPIAYDEKLNGTPDYLFAKRSPLGKTVLEFPLLAVVEAKKSDFEQGWGQCLAELVAMQKLNNDSISTVYGIVTDGKYWEFGQLTENLFTKNRESFSIDALPELLGALDFLLSAARQPT